MTGGILESTADYAIYHPQAGTLSIEGGTVAGAAGGLSINRGTAIITGGIVTSQGTGDTGTWPDGTSGQSNAAITVGAAYGDVALVISDDAVITAPDGIPAISVPESDKAQAIAISGGTFSQPLELGYCADGYIPTAITEGDVTTYGVKATDAVAVIAKDDGTYTECASIPQAVSFVPANVPTTITVLRDITNCDQTKIDANKNVSIDLNGHDIGFVQGDEGIPDSYGYFFVNGGALTLTGKGKVYEQGPYYGAIRIMGSTEDIEDYSVVDVGKDVTLEGWAPLFIANNDGCAYGVKVTMAGTANSVKDIDEAGGHGVYINGSIQKIEGNVPQITLTETSKVTSIGNGIYAAGYAHWTLAGDVSGADALSIKSGTFTITGGDYRGTGSFADPAEAHGNGSENTGAAVTITTNDGYAQAPIVMDISGTPTFTSVNGYAFYEGIAKKADGTPAATASRAVIAITGGDFTGSKTNVALTADIAITTAKDKQVVSGGTFSKPVALAYCAPGYIPVFKDGKYTVDGTAVAAVANPAAQGAYLGYGTLDALIKASRNGTEVLIVKPGNLGEGADLLKTATGGDNAASGAAAYDVAETLGGTFKVKNDAIVYAYQLGISKIAISGSDITVVVRLEEDDAAVTRTLEGRKVRVVSDKKVLAETDAVFKDGACVLTVSNVADSVVLTIEVLSAAEAETPAE